MRRTKKQRVAAWPVGEEAPPHQPRLLAAWQAGSLNRPLMHVSLQRRLVRPPPSPVTSPSSSSATTDSRIFSLNHQRLADQTTVPNSHHQNEFPLPPRCLHRRHPPQRVSFAQPFTPKTPPPPPSPRWTPRPSPMPLSLEPVPQPRRVSPTWPRTPRMSRAALSWAVVCSSQLCLRWLPRRLWQLLGLGVWGRLQVGHQHPLNHLHGFG